nr:bifunctional fucokinase/L-fucose-1-P-guanylyltransferase [Paramuribaculum sp.]
TLDIVLTGVTENIWHITLSNGVCLDIEPIGENGFVVRPYGFDDPMNGKISSPDTKYMGKPFLTWLNERDITLEESPDTDIQSARIYAVTDNLNDAETIARWAVSEPENTKGRNLWIKARKLSADEICEYANLIRLNEQRRKFLNKNISMLADNYRKSIFYQLDLNHLAQYVAPTDITIPETLDNEARITQSMRNHMYRSRVMNLRDIDGCDDEAKAFALMRGGMVDSLGNRLCSPRLSVFADQIVWSRSPLRIDFAGGWTDTPPYSIEHGGCVVNMAVELNGQPPLQVFVKPSKKYEIILRSIDMGASEVITNYSELSDFHKVGSPFSLPKAALTLCGFNPKFCSEQFASLREQLMAFGSGIEITLLSAVPAGSGMGTSSILGSTILSALNDFCSLSWDTDEICNRTFAMEQLLTTGGGWQDQYGGITSGVKLLRTSSGWQQRPTSDWLPESIFTDSNLRECHLLYYTGLTRTAKNILIEIVRRMMLNDNRTLNLLNNMKLHAEATAAAIQRRDFHTFGKCIAKSREYNELLDSGTCTPQIQKIIDSISDYAQGMKLTGAGGGGFLYIAAKDPEAATRIKRILTENRQNPSARLVEMTPSGTGTQVSRS